MGSPAARSGCSSRKSSAQTESESSRPLRTPYIFEAFALSVIAHVLLLAWPLAVPGGSGLGIAAEHAAPALRVFLAAEPATHTRLVEADAASPPERSPERESSNATPLAAYYPARALSRMPQAIGRFDVQPPPGGDEGIHGKLSMRLWIDETGTLERLKVLASDLPKPYEDAAVAAFSRLRFAPGEINGAAVRTSLDVVIEYADLAEQLPDAKGN